MLSLKESAALAVSCLDLTNLNDDCDAAAITALCRKAQTRHGNVAAVCVWPAFVEQAKRELAGTGIKVATVVNFPTGQEPIAAIRAMTEKAVADGADEIDMVIPWGDLVEGKPEVVAPTVRSVRSAAGTARIKAILESGMLEQPELIRQAAELALNGGADFLKTSTGKVPFNATPEAARIIMDVIKQSGETVGFKPSGGVKTAEDAANYIAIANAAMGEGWATPDTFRIGASGVLNDLLAVLDGGADRAKSEGGY